MSGNQPVGGPKGASDGDKAKAGSDAAKTSAKPGGSAAPIEVKGSSKPSVATAEAPSVAPVVAPKITPSGASKPVATPVAAATDSQPRVTKAASTSAAPQKATPPAPKQATPTSSVKPASSAEPMGKAKTAPAARPAAAPAVTAGAASGAGVGGAAAAAAGATTATSTLTPETFLPAGGTATSAGGAFTVSSAAAEAPAGAPGAAKAPAKVGTPRKVKLTLSRINPLSAMKLSFFVALALGIGTIVAVWILWHLLDNMHLFSDLDNFVNTTLGSEAGQPKKFEINDWVELGKVMTWTTMIAAANVVIMTILATLGTVVYNIISAVVGGLHVTLTDD